MRKLLWLIVVPFTLIGIMSVANLFIPGLWSMIFDGIASFGVGAWGFLLANPLVLAPIGIGITALGFIAYQRHEWHVWDKIRGRTQQPYIPQNAPVSQLPQQVIVQPTGQPIAEEKPKAT